MVTRAHSTLVYATLFFVSLAGLAKTSWWLACAGSAILVILSVVGRDLAAGRMLVSNRGSDAVISIASILNGSAIASAAYLLGRAAGWLWGI